MVMHLGISSSLPLSFLWRHLQHNLGFNIHNDQISLSILGKENRLCDLSVPFLLIYGHEGELARFPERNGTSSYRNWRQKKRVLPGLPKEQSLSSDSIASSYADI